MTNNRLDQFFIPISLTIIGLLIIDAIVEYNQGEFSVFVIKDFINLAIIIGALGLLVSKIVTKNTVFVICIYSVIASILVSLPFRLNNPLFIFESYFLKVELIIIILTFAIGIFIHSTHMLISVAVNLIFITICATAMPEYPIEKYLFYAVFVGGSGLLGYTVNTYILRLTAEIEKSNETISEQNEELKVINESKDELIKILGHDLSTPFNQLTGLISLMEITSDEKEFKEIQSMMKNSIQSGNKLLVDLSSWVHSSAEKLLAEQKLYPIIDVVNEVFNFFEISAQSKNITLVNLSSPELKVNFDQKKMEALIRNLVSNAIKFSPRNSEITINSNTELEFIHISVTDQGVGMDQQMLDQLLLNKDRNVSHKGTENEVGTGNGLNICKRILEDQNGRLEIRSEINKGTIFDIVLPKP